MSALWLSCTPSPASAQNKTLIPNWVAGSWGSFLTTDTQPVSNNGTMYLGLSSTAFGIYNIANRSCIAWVQSSGAAGDNMDAISSACFSADSKSVYYASSGGYSSSVITVWTYDIATGAQAQLKIAEKTLIHGLIASRNGNTLAYLVAGSDGTSDVVCIYDLKAKTVKRFAYSNSSTGNEALTLCFVDNDTEIAGAGPVIYDLTGKKLFSAANPAPIVSSPNEAKVFGCDNTNFTVTGYSVTPTPSKLWTASASSLFTEYSTIVPPMSVSGDNKALLIGGAVLQGSTLQSVIECLSTSTGKLIGTLSPAQNFGVLLGSAAIPGAKNIIVGPGAEGNSSAEVSTFNSATGSATYISDLFNGGWLDTGVQPLISVPWSAASNGVAFVDIELGTKVDASHYYPITVRDSGSGKILSTIATPNPGPMPVMSPSGNLLAQLTMNYLTKTFSVTVSKVGAGSVVASASFPAADLPYTYGWAGGSTIWVLDSGQDAIELFTLSGNKLTPSSSMISWPSTSLNQVLPGGVAMSPSNDRLIVSFTAGTRIYNPNTLALLDTIDQSGTVQTAKGYLLGIHPSLQNGTDTASTSELIYGIGKAPGTLLRTVGYSVAAGTGPLLTCGALSPDGAFAAVEHSAIGGTYTSDVRAQGSVRVFRLSDGSTASQWDNQFDPADPRGLVFGADASTLSWISNHGFLFNAPIPPTLFSVTASPNLLVAGGAASGSFTLNRAATSAATVTLSSSSNSLAVPKGGVAIAAGQKSGTFAITTTGVDSRTVVTITASQAALGSASCVVVLKPATIASLSLSPSNVNGGASSTGTVTLNGPAGPSGVVVAVSSKNSSVASPTVATLKIPSGGNSATFTIKTTDPSSNTTVEIDVAAQGVKTSADLVVNHI